MQRRTRAVQVTVPRVRHGPCRRRGSRTVERGRSARPSLDVDRRHETSLGTRDRSHLGRRERSNARRRPETRPERVRGSLRALRHNETRHARVDARTRPSPRNARRPCPASPPRAPPRASRCASPCSWRSSPRTRSRASFGSGARPRLLPSGTTRTTKATARGLAAPPRGTRRRRRRLRRLRDVVARQALARRVVVVQVVQEAHRARRGLDWVPGARPGWQVHARKVRLATQEVSQGHRLSRRRAVRHRGVHRAPRAIATSSSPPPSATTHPPKL